MEGQITVSFPFLRTLATHLEMAPPLNSEKFSDSSSK
jgi:hypothetical protein